MRAVLVAAAAPFDWRRGPNLTRSRPASGFRSSARPAPLPTWGVLAGPAAANNPQISLPDLGVSRLRRDDLLALDFRFFNLALQGGLEEPPQLAIKDTSQAAYLVAVFNAPQNIAEQAFLETYRSPKNSLTAEPPVRPPVGTFAAAPSRLAFQLLAPFPTRSTRSWIGSHLRSAWRRSSDPLNVYEVTGHTFMQRRQLPGASPRADAGIAGAVGQREQLIEMLVMEQKRLEHAPRHCTGLGAHIDYLRKVGRAAVVV